MEPSYRSGDYVLVGTARWLWKAKPGDAIVFRHQHLGVLIKRVVGVDAERKSYAVEGTHSDSTDAANLGPAPFGSVIGRVLLHVPRRRR
jgi:signal peptidase I